MLTRIFLGVFVGSLVLALIGLAIAAKSIPATDASCVAARGTPTFDHDGYRCMKGGRAIDPNDEVTP